LSVPPSLTQKEGHHNRYPPPASIIRTHLLAVCKHPCAWKGYFTLLYYAHSTREGNRRSFIVISQDLTCRSSSNPSRNDRKGDNVPPTALLPGIHLISVMHDANYTLREGVQTSRTSSTVELDPTATKTSRSPKSSRLHYHRLPGIRSTRLRSVLRIPQRATDSRNERKTGCSYFPGISYHMHPSGCGSIF
jgi:hypothetical protein